MKNAFGGLLHNRRHYPHSWIHRTLVDLLAIQKEIRPGTFAVMDGTTASDGPGPIPTLPRIAGASEWATTERRWLAICCGSVKHCVVSSLLHSDHLPQQRPRYLLEAVVTGPPSMRSALP
jgi:hypothetical protein